MSNPSYAKAAAKLMNASRASGGVEAAGEHVEWAARYGTSHLKPENFLQLSIKQLWQLKLLAKVVPSMESWLRSFAKKVISRSY